ncbi:nuclear transport factor 2 family protein [Pseudomonas nitroreducens]|uniref:YybH family protein n=1 Tax=Pseudomonas nitroreducens TaxID=46680 RepID=UPI00351CCB74
MSAAENTQANAELHALLASWLSAVHACDAQAIAGHYSHDILAFDAVKQLQFRGVEAYTRHWAECLQMCTEHSFDMHQLSFEVSGDIAFGHYLAYCGGTDKDGVHNSAWARATLGLRREQGQWKIAHEHFSIPFDPATGQLLFDAKP